MKGILVIADGLGGRPTDMDGLTCLEQAKTPVLDGLAETGALGLVDPIGPGVRPGSDTAHLSLLGYNPYEVYTGRGVYECLGIGLGVQAGDICFRANFGSVEARRDELIVTDRRAGRINEGQADLETAINAFTLETVPGVTFEGENDPHGTDLPAHAFEPLPGHENDDAAKRTAAALNEFAAKAHRALNGHPVNVERMGAGKAPANYVLARGAAECPHIPSIESIYGVRGAVVAGGALYKGVALACGMTTIDVPGATGGLDTDLGAKATAAIEALKSFDYVFVHIKGTDNAGHDSDAQGKSAFIARIDREFFGPLIAGIDRTQTHIAFTGDHCTPIDYGDHTVEPVPVLMVGPNVVVDASTEFGETAAGLGGLGRWSGRLLPMVLGYSNWAPKFGS